MSSGVGPINSWNCTGCRGLMGFTKSMFQMGSVLFDAVTKQELKREVSLVFLFSNFSAKAERVGLP